MYIKEVIIKNFKSYKSKNIIQDLVPGQNIVVGKNGSGKTNFFQAIEFVLMDNIRYLKEHEKYSYYYNGRQCLAYVEVVLADCDPRLDFDGNELRIRRTLLQNKDSFFINNKRTIHKRVKAVLEICGLAYPRPFFIINQKVINSMVLQPKKKLLEYLIKALSTGISENIISLNDIIKRIEVVKGKVDFVESIIKCNTENTNQIEENLNLQKFRKLKSLKSTLSVLIVKHNLDILLKKRMCIKKKILEQSAEISCTQRLKKLNDSILRLETSLKLVRENIDLYKDLKKDILQEKERILKKREKMKLSTNDLQKKLSLLKKSCKEESKEIGDLDLSELDSKISSLSVDLAEVHELYCVEKERLELNEEILASKEQRNSDIISIVAKLDSFTTKEKRDTWINKKISFIESERRALKAKYVTLCKSRTPLGELLTQYESNLQKLENNATDEIQLIQEEKDVKSRIFILQTDLSDLRRKESKLIHKIEPLKKIVNERNTFLRKRLGNGVLRGNKSVMSILEDWRLREGPYKELITGYHGRLIDIFDCHDTLNIIIDVTAGKKLFLHIVSNEKIGTEILKDMNRKNLPGEVGFMLLNRLQVPFSATPYHEGAIPLISRLQYQEEMEVVIKFIFGKVLICKNFETSIELAKFHNITCVTLDGDKVSGNGIITGGYLKPQLTFRTAYKELNETETKVNALSSEYDETTSKIVHLENEIDKSVSLLHRIKSRLNVNARQTERPLLQEKLNDIKKEIDFYNVKIQEVEHSLKKLQISEEGLRAQLHKELAVEHPELLEELKKLNKEIRKYKQQVAKSKILVIDLETKKCNLEVDYETLQKRREMKISEVDELKTCKVKHKCNLKELEILDRRTQILSNDLEKLEENILEAIEKDKEYVAQLEILRSERDGHTRRTPIGNLEYYQKKLEMLGNRIEETHILLKKHHMEAEHNTDYSKYKHYSFKQLNDELKKVIAGLKQCGLVNQKADWHAFETKKLLKAMGKTIDEFFIGFNMIMEYEDWLRQFVTYALEQIHLKFSATVNEMLPEHLVSLVFSRQEPETLRGCMIDDLNGASIIIHSLDGQIVHHINALSGGEKTTILLCLIFAYSQISQITTFILDEVDRALDNELKTKIGGLLNNLKNHIQFFTSAHSKEFFSIGENFLAVSYINMSSEMQTVSRNNAEKMIENLRNTSIHDSTSSSAT